MTDRRPTADRPHLRAVQATDGPAAVDVAALMAEPLVADDAACALVEEVSKDVADLVASMGEHDARRTLRHAHVDAEGHLRSRTHLGPVPD